MFEISKYERFESAHKIKGHTDPMTGKPGKCSRRHGHGYVIRVVLRSKKAQKIGFTVDYYWIGRLLKEIADGWDHQDLNKLPDFKGTNTAAENIARVLYTKFKARMDDFPELKKQLKKTKTQLYYTEVKETEKTYARYYPKGCK